MLPLLGAALLCATWCCAQTAATGAIAGKLTDLRSKPLGSVTVILRNTLTGMETRTSTAKNGAYQFAGLAPGEYTLEAKSALGQGHLDDIEITAGFEAHMQAAVALEPLPAAQPPALVAAAAAMPATSSPANAPAPAPEPKPAPAAAFAAIQPTPRITPSQTQIPVESTFAREQAQTLPTAPRALPKMPPPTRTAKAMPSSPQILPKIAAIPEDSLHATARPANAESASETVAAVVRTRAFFAQLAAMQEALTAAAAAAPPSLDATPIISTSATLTGEEMRSLPVANRNWQEFTLNSPPAGNQISGASGSEFGEEMRTSNAMTVDGANTKLAFGGRGASSAAATQIGPAAGESAVQSVEVSSGSPLSGERTRVETRRGGAGLDGYGLHGALSLFERQNFFGAQNPYTYWIKQTAPATLTTVPVFTEFPYTPSNHSTTWSASLGGPLRRYHLAWFGSVDGNERDDPGVSTVRHPINFFAQPTNDEMQVLSARLGLGSANPVAEGLAAYSTMLSSLTELLGPAPRSSSQFTGFGRIDWSAFEHHRFTLEGSGSRRNAPGGGLSSASETYGNHSFGGLRSSSTWMLGRWEAFLTPNLLAVTQGSMGRQTTSLPAETPSAFEQAFNINNWGQLPQMVVDSRYGFTIGNPSRFGAGSYPDEHLYEAQEGLHWIHGKLLLNAGADLSHNTDTISLLRNHTGTYHYSRIENFISDALVFEKYGITDALDPLHQHNCDPEGKAWRDSAGQLHGLGYLPCYSSYTQTLGPTNWNLSTNDWAAFLTAQWRPAHALVLSASMRWAREQLPPPIPAVNNPDLPLTEKLPSFGNQWAPRVSLAWGIRESRWPVLQLGYGMYYGRTTNSAIETALTQTGSPNGDLNFYFRPTDNLQGESGGAPPFPYVLAGEPSTFVTPGAVAFAPNFRNPEIHQALAGIEERLPGRFRLNVDAEASLARRLPVTFDTNIDPAANPKTITYAVVDPIGAGPIKTQQITVPFYANWPTLSGNGRLNASYQQVVERMSRANSTYEALAVRLTRMARNGLTFRLSYIYSHATDWNPNESGQVNGISILDPADFAQEYGTGNLDMRHSVSGTVLWEAPWKLTGAAGWLANGWSLAALGHYHSGLPYTMRTAGSIPEEFLTSGAAIVGLGSSMNGYGGDNRVYGVGRNTYRYPATWKADVRLARRFKLSHGAMLELMAESFNLFNHQNVTQIETTGYYIEPGSASGALPTLNFMTGLTTDTVEFGQPLNINATDYYRPRQFDFGLRLRFKIDPKEEQ